MILSILIPVYNEAANLETLLTRVLAVPLEKEIIVVDDHSHDASPAILEKFSARNFCVIRHEKNQGKGAAV
ncbi:MAG: glycosyltransferase, partial [Chloroflexi bacterium]|nr:glycosyltransferase [Chloroflexota bacterium]